MPTDKGLDTTSDCGPARYVGPANAPVINGESKDQTLSDDVSWSLIPMRFQTKDVVDRRFGRVSGARSGCAVRSVGDLPETALTALTRYSSLESALVLGTSGRQIVRSEIRLIYVKHRARNEKSSPFQATI